MRYLFTIPILFLVFTSFAQHDGDSKIIIIGQLGVTGYEVLEELKEANQSKFKEVKEGQIPHTLIFISHKTPGYITATGHLTHVELIAEAASKDLSGNWNFELSKYGSNNEGIFIRAYEACLRIEDQLMAIESLPEEAIVGYK